MRQSDAYIPFDGSPNDRTYAGSLPDGSPDRLRWLREGRRTHLERVSRRHPGRAGEPPGAMLSEDLPHGLTP